MAGSVFGELGGPGQQQGGGLVPDPTARPTNDSGNVTNNPSGDGIAPPQESVFGDLGGGVSSQTGGPLIPNTPGRDPGGQGGK